MPHIHLKILNNSVFSFCPLSFSIYSPFHITYIYIYILKKKLSLRRKTFDKTQGEWEITFVRCINRERLHTHLPMNMKKWAHVVFPRNNGLRNEGWGRHPRRRQRNENDRFGYDRNGQDNERVGFKPCGERHHYNDPIRPLEGVDANDRHRNRVDQILDYLNKKYGPTFCRYNRPVCRVFLGI